MCFELIRAYLIYLSEKYRCKSPLSLHERPEEEVTGNEKENLGKITRTLNIDIPKKSKQNSQNLDKRNRESSSADTAQNSFGRLGKALSFGFSPRSKKHPSLLPAQKG